MSRNPVLLPDFVVVAVIAFEGSVGRDHGSIPIAVLMLADSLQQVALSVGPDFDFPGSTAFAPGQEFGLQHRHNFSEGARQDPGRRHIQPDAGHRRLGGNLWTR